MFSYEEAVELASRDEAFKATVYAMNTLLIHKGVYTKQEYRQLFAEWVGKEERKKGRDKTASLPQTPAQISI
jgi:molybdopterin synthase catalytic subunit